MCDAAFAVCEKSGNMRKNSIHGEVEIFTVLEEEFNQEEEEGQSYELEGGFEGEDWGLCKYVYIYIYFEKPPSKT